MAYISAKEVKVMREEIVKLFPKNSGWKFSISLSDHTGVNVVILESPFKLIENKYVNLHPMHIKEMFDGRENVQAAIEKIFEIVNRGNFDKSDPMTDYFHVGWYVHFYIGNWDKAFKWNKQKIKEVA